MTLETLGNESAKLPADIIHSLVSSKLEEMVDRIRGSCLRCDVALLPQLDRDGWWNEPAQSEKLRVPLLRLCARYLTRQPAIRIDPVARSHLGNGARLERINWLGNTESRALQGSFGIMVNYLCDHDSIEDIHEALVHVGTIARSADVDALLHNTD